MGSTMTQRFTSYTASQGPRFPTRPPARLSSSAVLLRTLLLCSSTYSSAEFCSYDCVPLRVRDASTNSNRKSKHVLERTIMDDASSIMISALPPHAMLRRDLGVWAERCDDVLAINVGLRFVKVKKVKDEGSVTALPACWRWCELSRMNLSIVVRRKSKVSDDFVNVLHLLPSHGLDWVHQH
ncbi:hypothetical protein L1887_51865 [Cichorium endivia]|nr:hypothetical protein L1887_51865 [Cichorium endivia]